jgi:16S rRNA (uracil1498-N3)-methyltransferase
MHRFFVPRELLSNPAPLTGARYELPQAFTLPKELAHQIRDVIRLDIGEHLLLLDNSGDEILATVAKINKASVEVHLLERRPGRSEPATRIILCQGLLKSTRFEWILEKGTELGVAAFSPIICRRSMAGLEDTGSSKIQRWQRIIQEAAEQSGRSRLPELLPVRPLEQALNSIPSNALAIMPWEEEHALTLHDVLSTSIRPGRDVGATLAVARPPHDALNPPDGNVGATLAVARPPQTPPTIVLFIGPEGGLMAEEVALAQRHGVQVVTLGARILRAETAAIATVANIMYECEQ